MKRWERIAAAILIFCGVAAASLAYRMGFGTVHQPGPGFFPFWLGTVLALVSFLYFMTRLGSEGQPISLWDKGAWIRPGLAAAIMLVYANLMDFLGFFSATFILFLAWLAIIERERLMTIGLVSVLGTASLYIIFIVFLRVPLPKGVLF